MRDRLFYLMLYGLVCCGLSAEPWRRHAIDDTSIGADGVRLMDVNRDGRLDIATGWEEGGLIRVYLHPGPEAVRAVWPRVTVGRVASPEDAVFVDLDRDGSFDVLSSCEGSNRSLCVHWAPANARDYLSESKWTTGVVECAKDRSAWMFALPLTSNNPETAEIMVGGKGDGALIGVLYGIGTSRDLTGWKLAPQYRAGWIMSLLSADIDGDGDMDVLASDRKTETAGVLWLENPGPAKSRENFSWNVHRLGLDGEEIMFLDNADLNRDGSLDVLACYKPNLVSVLSLKIDGRGRAWEIANTIRLPANAGSSKAVKAGDMDGDGILDIVATCEGANGKKSGVWLWRRAGDAFGASGEWTDIGGPEGEKFDRIELADLDEDGDLDLITCEERDRLGVIWYENPF